MNNINKKVFKNNYYNYKSLIVLLSFIVLLLLSFKYSFFLYPLFIISIIIIMSIISYIKEINFLKEVYSYKNKEKLFSYKPITVDNKVFINNLKDYGIPLSYIEITNIYAIEVVKRDNEYICYIDDIEFNNLKDFLNYTIDNTCLKEIKKIRLLSYNNEDPSTYLKQEE